jgi:hypothetical protein
MRTIAFIRVRAEEATIRAIDKQVCMPDSRVHKLRASKVGGTEWWDWETSPIVVDSWSKMEDGLIALLQEHRKRFPILRSFAAMGATISLQIMTDFFHAELDRGFRQSVGLSYDGIALLNELGAALEYDFIPLREGPL